MIISILGTAGRDWKTQELSPVFYDCKALGKEDGRYLNSTDMLLKNYDDSFFFLGTKKAIAVQKEILDIEGKEVRFIEISDTGTEDIYEQVLSLLDAHQEESILDVTHGFRHQPIAAIFAATLYRFLNHSKLQILFAKEAEGSVEKQYAYVFLDDYLVLSQLSFQLSGFLQTLNFVESASVPGFDTSVFHRFSDALLANDFTSLCKHYQALEQVLNKAKEDERYRHLSHLFDEILKTLSVFDTFGTEAIYTQYLAIAKLLLDKNYLLLSLTYMFEALRAYASTSFYEKGIIKREYWEKNESYYINQDVITFVTQKYHKRYRENFYDKEYPELYENNKEIFSVLAGIYIELRNRRNHLTHISLKATKYNIELALEKSYDEIFVLFEKNPFAALKV